MWISICTNTKYVDMSSSFTDGNQQSTRRIRTCQVMEKETKRLQMGENRRTRNPGVAVPPDNGRELLYGDGEELHGVRTEYERMNKKRTDKCV